MDLTWDCLKIMMDETTISVGKTHSGLLVVFQEKIEKPIEQDLKEKDVKLLDPMTFIGKTEEETVSAIKDHCIFRIAERDGKGNELTASFLPFRWNLYIANGKIVNVRMF